MNADQTKEILKNFAFSEEESDLYIAALGLNRPTLAQIAKAAGKGRTAAYFHLKKLIGRGIVKEIKGAKVAQYQAKAPEELAAVFDRLTTDFKSLVPFLSALQKTESAKPLIEVYESKKGYYQIYDEISALPHNSYFMVVEGGEAVRSETKLLDGQQWEMFFSRIAERKIMTKAVFTEEVLQVPAKHMNKKALDLIGQRIWNIHILPEEKFPLKDLFFIYGNRVAILFPKDALVIKIQHDAIAELFKVIFNTLYELGRPAQNPWSNKMQQ